MANSNHEPQSFQKPESIETICDPSMDTSDEPASSPPLDLFTGDSPEHG